MKIIWRDTDLTKHEINLTNAVDVKIDGIAIQLSSKGGIKIQSDEQLQVLPIASNCVHVKEKD